MTIAEFSLAITDVIHKEGTSLSSSDNRLSIKLAVVKEGQADVKWIDARYQIAGGLTKHASKMSEDVLQQVIDQTQWRITTEDTMLETRSAERDTRILEFPERPACPQRNTKLRYSRPLTD